MVKKAIVFTDIRQSSVLWKTYPKLMNKALEQHEKQIKHNLEKYKGIVIKTIGDSFMLMFGTFDLAFNYCLNTIKYIDEHPIYLQKDVLRIRMGMCYGTVSIKKTNIQGFNLLDLFGPAVNKASRMESKVSDVGGFACCLDDNKELPAKYLTKDLGKDVNKNVKIQVAKYSDSCNKDIIRSKRLLNSLQLKYDCYDSSELKGVGSVLAYKYSI